MSICSFWLEFIVFQILGLTPQPSEQAMSDTVVVLRQTLPYVWPDGVTRRLRPLGSPKFHLTLLQERELQHQDLIKEVRKLRQLLEQDDGLQRCHHSDQHPPLSYSDEHSTVSSGELSNELSEVKAKKPVKSSNVKGKKSMKATKAARPMKQMNDHNVKGKKGMKATKAKVKAMKA